MAKSLSMEEFLDKTAKSLFGISRCDAFNKGICVSCGNPVNFGAFRTKLDLKEYEISGMCQDCQDLVFGVEDD